MASLADHDLVWRLWQGTLHTPHKVSPQCAGWLEPSNINHQTLRTGNSTADAEASRLLLLNGTKHSRRELISGSPVLLLKVSYHCLVQSLAGLQVLSNEEKRTVYDVYGKQGLEAGMELGECLRTPDQLKKDYQNFQAQRVTSCFSIQSPACPMTHPTPEMCCRPQAQIPAVMGYNICGKGARLSEAQAPEL